MNKILTAVMLMSSVGYAKPSKEYINNKIVQAALENGVDPLLLKSICQAESSSKLDPQAFNYSDGGNNNHAFGICQLLYSTASGLGFKDLKCKKKFPDKTNRKWSSCKLFGPYTNATYAAKYLSRQLKRYKGNVNKAISSYNLGSVKYCKTGSLTIKFKDQDTGKTKIYKKKCVKGDYLNSYYVKKVNRNLKKLKQIK